ncbi:NAD(P)/FAD-dependent oxidoreductase [Gimesia fumaroli]|uniref:NADH:ubiquinone reductase (non-electrogenic) n=1 Tax=Gimesia fumaroli TaxID=2527976 RepID=A0A518IIF4_9PLAN|nr:NAD(P)/FAD-dependent oxidoreductase [Gimesia fumaroli]QDV52867.1 NADH dehydrogenase-like protein [Gimesia fumaroli]
MNRSSNLPRIVIIGGGFAGINVAKSLKDAPVEIDLVDKHNYHLFQPLLYQVATGELDPANIAAPIRKILWKQKNVHVALGEVTAIDFDKKLVDFDGGELDYDYLVIASGAQQSYFGHDEFRAHAPGLKSIDDALEIRRRLFLAFEEAEWEADEEARRKKLTFVIVGGGPTGVELAGAVKEVATETLPREFRNIHSDMARVIIVDGGQRLVGPMPEDLGVRAQHVLEKMGVEIHLNVHVTDVTAEGVKIGDETIPAENVFWAAGVQGQDLAKTLDTEVDRGSRIVVGPDLSIPNHPEVFVVGDAAHATDATTGNPVPGLAQGAIQTGRFVAEIIKAEIAGNAPKERPQFSYHDKGSMAMIGRGNAIAAIGKIHYGGILGWISWNVLHVMFLVGFRNRFKVMLDWLWNYIWKTRRSRLITGDPEVHIKQLYSEHQQPVIKPRRGKRDNTDEG